MEKKTIYMVTEFYIPYKHNGCTEANEVTLFTEQRKAIDFIRGTDGNGDLRKHDEMVGIWLKNGCKPEYELGTNLNGITFKVKEECLAESALKQGGYVYKVTLEEKVVF